jgi:hypothetical protein
VWRVSARFQISKRSFNNLNATGMAAIPQPFFANYGGDESDAEAELEVDQLDSDSDNDAVDPTNANNISKNGTGRGVRIPGYTVLSPVRIENMIQADGLYIHSTIPSSRSSLN